MYIDHNQRALNLTKFYAALFGTFCPAFKVHATLRGPWALEMNFTIGFPMQLRFRKCVIVLTLGGRKHGREVQKPLAAAKNFLAKIFPQLQTEFLSSQCYTREICNPTGANGKPTREIGDPKNRSNTHFDFSCSVIFPHVSTRRPFSLPFICSIRSVFTPQLPPD